MALCWDHTLDGLDDSGTDRTVDNKVFARSVGWDAVLWPFSILETVSLRDGTRAERGVNTLKIVQILHFLRVVPLRSR